MKTLQEIFDTVATHLLTQGVRSYSVSGCAYRGNNGLMCAVGCLIPDEHYSPEIEGLTVNGGNPKLNQILLQSSIDITDANVVGLLVELQGVHDLYFPITWRDLLYDLAKRFGLGTEVLDTHKDEKGCSV